MKMALPTTPLLVVYGYILLSYMYLPLLSQYCTFLSDLQISSHSETTQRNYLLKCQNKMQT